MAQINIETKAHKSNGLLLMHRIGPTVTRCDEQAGAYEHRRDQ